MVNWKNRYLEIKFKYINTKQKAGSQPLEQYLNTIPRNFNLMILNALKNSLKNDLKIKYSEMPDINIEKLIDIENVDIKELIEDKGFFIEINEDPINYSLAFIKKVLHNKMSDIFYLLNEVTQTDDEEKPVELTLQKIDDYDYINNVPISLTQEIIKVTDLSDLVFYPTQENILTAIENA